MTDAVGVVAALPLVGGVSGSGVVVPVPGVPGLGESVAVPVLVSEASAGVPVLVLGGGVSSVVVPVPLVPGLVAGQVSVGVVPVMPVPGAQGVQGDVGPQGVPGPPGANTIVYGEVPSGAIDGVNVTFKLSNSFAVGTLQVFLNGLRETHYSEDSPYITFSSAPQATDGIVVDYQLSS